MWLCLDVAISLFQPALSLSVVAPNQKVNLVNLRLRFYLSGMFCS